MKALVVGGAGFIGSHLCDALLEKGHQVVCADNFSLGTRENIGHLKENPNFCVYETDASCEESLEEVFQKEEPEYVFHLAANSDIQGKAILAINSEIGRGTKVTIIIPVQGG